MPDRDAPHRDRPLRRDVRRGLQRADLHALPQGILRLRHGTEPQLAQGAGGGGQGGGTPFFLSFGKFGVRSTRDSFVTLSTPLDSFSVTEGPCFTLV